MVFENGEHVNWAGLALTWAAIAIRAGSKG